MIEIRISNTDAVQLLINRIGKEFNSRKKYGLYNKTLSLEELPFSELFELTEISAFDIAAMLPFDIYNKETNIADIISKAIQSLATIFHKEEFVFYTPGMAEILTSPLREIYQNSEEKKLYIKN